MRTVRVKICGITNETDLVDAVNAGADAVGFVVGVQSSPRNLSVGQAQSLLSRVSPFVSSVVVTKESNLQSFKRLNSLLRPNFLQIYCDIGECENVLKELNEDVSTILGVYGESSSLQDLVSVSRLFDAILLDTLSPTKSGGTGRVHDWNTSKRLREALDPKPIVLAGGLTPENVAEAVKTVKPYAVDVASGVELSPGKKDRAKLMQFIKNAKEVQL
jgi:phosphoribosylanthranilate isomerase